MHTLEPYYNWRGLYAAEEDPFSPFFQREYSEFEYSKKIYNYYIHPQWDDFGSQTLFLKILYTSYEEGYAILELIGEWNDLLYNDIMFLKREVAECIMQHGIYKFILIGENVLNYHGQDDSYYAEWYEELEDNNGWLAMVNLQPHVLEDIGQTGLDSYMVLGGNLNEFNWRTMHPHQFFQMVQHYVVKRLA
ncbi:MAG: hypothetical protein ACKVOR_05480 [Flavobacteriales bacterium]